MTAVSGFPSQPLPMDTFHMKLPNLGVQLNNNNNNPLSNTVKRSKFKLEPMKVLEPSNKKLSLPESQRIMYILEDFIKQIEILDYIEIITNSDEKCRNLLKSELNDEEKKRNVEQIFITMCQNHRTLVDAFKKAKLQKSNEANAKNKETLEMLIKSSCKDILRVLLTKQNFFENLKKEFLRSKPDNQRINDLLSD